MLLVLDGGEKRDKEKKKSCAPMTVRVMCALPSKTNGWYFPSLDCNKEPRTGKKKQKSENSTKFFHNNIRHKTYYQ